jgi:hypothetical protein
MTPADEAHFIQLWQQGASYRDLAQALGCPLGTVASRSAGGGAMSARSLTPMLTYLLIAIPLTVGMWGTFWLVHRRRPWMPWERRLFWGTMVWCVITLVELTVFVGVAADR